MNRLYSIIISLLLAGTLSAQNYKILKVGGDKKVMYSGKYLKSGDVVTDLSKIRWTSKSSWIKYFDTGKRILSYYCPSGKVSKGLDGIIVNHELSCKTGSPDRGRYDNIIAFPGVSMMDGDMIAVICYERPEFVIRYITPSTNAEGDLTVVVDKSLLVSWLKVDAGIKIPFYLVRKGNFHLLGEEYVWNV